MLHILGLSAEAESVYADAVSRPDPDVAASAECQGAHAALLLSELEAKGLIAERPGAPGRYTVAPPAVALEALLAAQRAALRQAEATAAELSEAYRLGRVAAAVPDLAEVVAGRPTMRRRFQELRNGATQEILALMSTKLITAAADAAIDGEGPENTAEAPDQPPHPRVRFRVVLERDVLDAPGAAPRLARVLGRREEARVTARVPAQLVIADRTRAMVQVTDAAALAVHAPALVGVLLAGFDTVWRHAEPVRLDASGSRVTFVPVAPPAGEPDQLDLRVLSLLLAGHTDATVANQLGLGLRTVQRRIRHLMELAGVETRIQLGWEARERGWAPV